MIRSLLRIWAIMRKELRQLARDRLTFGMVVGIPALQLLMFGYAINMDVRDLSAGVVDHAKTSVSRQIIADIDHSQVVNIIVRYSSVAQLERAIGSDLIDVGIVVPGDLEVRLADRSRPAIQLLLDDSDPVIGNSANALTAYSLGPNAAAPVIQSMGLYNPERKSAINIVPGLIGVILTLTMVLFTAVAVVRERERGNLEMLITTPVQSWELMVGKVIPYIGIGLIQTTLVLALGMWLFDMPIRGSLLDVYLTALAFIGASLTLGLVISTAAENQFQAMQMTIFILLPSILLSGFMFPFAGMPRAAQWIAELLPMTHFVRLIRGIVVRGSMLADGINEMYALLGFSAVMLTIAALRFKKSLD